MVVVCADSEFFECSLEKKRRKKNLILKHTFTIEKDIYAGQLLWDVMKLSFTLKLGVEKGYQLTHILTVCST